MWKKRSLSIEDTLLTNRRITESGCWEWTKARASNGYGVIAWNRRKYVLIHRLAAHLWKGFDIDSKLYVMHICDNPPCFNPDHLIIGTSKDNWRDAYRKGNRGLKSWGRTPNPHRTSLEIMNG